MEAAVASGDQPIAALPLEPGSSASDAPSRLHLRGRWNRRASFTTAVGVGAKAVSAAARVATIPLALDLLGVDRYGLWLSVGSLVAWISVIGPGLGSGLVNAVSEATAADDWAAVRRHVSTAVFTIGPAGALVVASGPIISQWPLLARLLGVAGDPVLTADATALLTIGIALFGLSLAFEFIIPLCAGLQEGYLSAASSAAASVASASGVVVLALGSGGASLVTFALVVGLPTALANGALAVYVLTRRRRQLWPSWRTVSRHSARALLGFGGWMFLMQIGDLAIFQSANVLVASHFGPGEVPRYAVPASVFMSVAAVCFLMVQPYWPAMREAMVRRDWDFIRATSNRTLRRRLAVMAVAAAFIVVAGPSLAYAWAGAAAVPPRSLLVAMSVQYLLIVLSGNYVVLLLTFGLVRTKAVLTLMVACAQVGGFFLLSPTLGLLSIPIGGAIGVLFDCLISARVAAQFMRERVDA